MKKNLLFIILGISMFVLSAYVGIQLISQNIPDEPKINSQDIVKVNVSEEKETEEKLVQETNTKFIEDEKNKVFSLSYPLDGEIGLSYSPEELIYSKTLKEWTVHNGIDIKAKRGTPVKASEDGVIENVTETTDKGIEITIAHENGYKTIYSNLSSRDMVRVGEHVDKGQAISGVGNTSAFEYYEPEHLHFEVKKDGKFVNPLDVLNK